MEYCYGKAPVVRYLGNDDAIDEGVVDLWDSDDKGFMLVGFWEK